MAHSDMGSQIVIEAPQGLLLVDPNAGGSFEQNWAAIEGAGLDPMQVKYVLLTHEHGDHAPGAYLWRVVTGAQVVASAEMAYVLQHHVPGGTVTVFTRPSRSISSDRGQGTGVGRAEGQGHAFARPHLGLDGLRLQKDGRTYVATGDLIMPGGVLGYSGSLDFGAQDVLRSLKKLAALRPDVVLGGHGGGGPEEFIAKGIENGEATGWCGCRPRSPIRCVASRSTNYLGGRLAGADPVGGLRRHRRRRPAGRGRAGAQGQGLGGEDLPEPGRQVCRRTRRGDRPSRRVAAGNSACSGWARRRRPTSSCPARRAVVLRRARIG